MGRYDRRYQILLAYSQDETLLTHVFQDSTDGKVFEDFIEQLFVADGRNLSPCL
jgi:hypothetical protein